MAKGVMTGAADAGRETAFVTGIIGGSYAVDVFIRVSAGGGADFIGIVLAGDGNPYGEAAVITGAAGLNTFAVVLVTIAAGGSYGEKDRLGGSSGTCACTCGAAGCR